MEIPKRPTISNINITLIFFFCLILFNNKLHSQKAFPTAYGHNVENISGGRGGNVYHVTNLLDDGSVGSLRWAIGQARPATIVFDVSGTIELQGQLNIERNDITIAGQTAPMGGITITFANPNDNIKIIGRPIGGWNAGTENIIIRYIRIRYKKDNNETGIQILGNNNVAKNIILDHVSLSYAGWTGIGARGTNTENIIVQNCLIAECKTGSIFGDSDVSTNSKNNSFNGNYFYNVSHRFPNPNTLGRIDIINNVIQNPKFRLNTPNFAASMNHINNYVASGANSNFDPSRLNRDKNTQQNHIYSAGNIIDQGVLTDPNASNEPLWSIWNAGSETALLPSNNFTNAPYTYLGGSYPLLSAVEAYNNVINNKDKGASKSLNADGSVSDSKDANDIAYFNKIAEGEGAYEPYTTGNNGNDRSFFFEQRYFDFLESISSIPINNRETDFYVSNPHIPEVWFLANVPLGQNHNDFAPSGYTWLEEYLNMVDVGVAGNVEATGVTITPNVATINLSQTIDLNTQFTPANTTDQSGIWTSENESIATVNSSGTVTGNSEGIVEIRFISNDGGFTGTSIITVIPIPLNAEAGEDQIICEGETVILSASGGSNYLWSTGETTQSIIVNPVSTTTYSVTISSGIQEDSDDVTVFVDAIPNLNISDDVTIVTGESTVLTVEGASNYLWSTGETTSSITVSPNTTETYIVTGTNGVCEVQAQVTVTVEQVFQANAGDDQSICEGSGDEVTLSAGVGDTYLWSTGETTQSIIVNPVSTTTYSVTISSGIQEDSDDVTVFVDAIPNLNISEDVTIVSGESAVLTIEGASNYLWSTGETTSNITVSPTETTIYAVSGFNGLCEVQAQVTVTVEQVFQANAGDDQSICEGSGDEVTLSAGVGDTYLWSTGETTQSIIVNPVSTTTYSVTISSGIQEDSDDVTVFVDPNPNVVIVNGDSVDILNGDFITLSASGANNYEWNNGATQPNIAVSPSATTIYEVRGYINDCYDEKQVTVNVFEPVQASAGEDINICINEVATLTATGGDEFLWSTGETTQSIQVSPLITTDYTVTVFNALDFDEAAVRVNVVGQCNDNIEDENEVSRVVSFNIYPNPANSYVNVSLKGGSEISNVLIYDFTGKVVQQNRIENQNQLQEINSRIELRSLSNGIYFIKLIDINGAELTKKLIIRDL